MLSYDGRLLLIKSVLYALPIFFMCTLALPIGIIEKLNKYLRHFLWRKFGVEKTRLALVSWDKVYKPKQQGGLGILDLADRSCI